MNSRVTERVTPAVDKALALAGRGVHVFPVRAGTKAPLTSRSFYDASTDPGQIAQWWNQHPDALVGYYTGASGLTVLDIDVKGEVPGYQALWNYHPDDYESCVFYNTPSGGQHQVFREPDPENPSAPAAPIPGLTNVDRRSGGSYAIWYGEPPTAVQWAQMPPAPDWLVKRKGQWSRTDPVGSVDLDDFLSKMTDGEPPAEINFTVEHYGDAQTAVRKIVERAAHFPETPGTRTAYDRVVEGYVNSSVASTAPDLRAGKVRALAQYFADRIVPEAENLAPVIKWAQNQAPAPDAPPTPDTFFIKSQLLAANLAKWVDDGLALGLDGEVWVYENGVFRQDTDIIMRRCVRLLGDRYRPAHTATVRDIVITRLRDSGRILPEMPNPDHINLLNGVLDWKSGELAEHTPDTLSTLQLPITYDPDATCPQFEAWLNTVLPKDVQPMVWEALGYLLMTGNPLQVAFLLYGSGGNGKGTFLRLMERMVGRGNVSNLNLQQLTERFGPVNLFGKTANICGDIDAKYLENPAAFKSITGQDTIKAEEKFKRAFSFRPYAVPVFSANQLWRSSDTGDSYFRRWVILPFTTKVPGGPFDEERLHMEAAGIFNKAIANLRVLMARGEFAPSGTALDASEEFKTQSDVVRLWLDDDDEVVMHEAGNTAISEKVSVLFDTYTMWCAESGHSRLSRTEFGKRLESAGYLEKRSSDARYRQGIKLRRAQHAWEPRA